MKLSSAHAAAGVDWEPRIGKTYGLNELTVWSRLSDTLQPVVFGQLDQNDPLEVVEFFNAMRRQKYSRHEAVHLIGQILGNFVFDVLENQKPFDLETYRKLLTKYKARDPKKLMDLLEDEPLLSEAD